jgi:hypothetical protein
MWNFLKDCRVLCRYKNLMRAWIVMSLSQVQNYMQPFCSKNQGYFLHTFFQWHDIVHSTYCGGKVYVTCL